MKEEEGIEHLQTTQIDESRRKGNVEQIIADAYRTIQRAANELIHVSGELKGCLVSRDGSNIKQIEQRQSEAVSESYPERDEACYSDQNAALPMSHDLATLISENERLTKELISTQRELDTQKGRLLLTKDIVHKLTQDKGSIAQDFDGMCRTLTEEERQLQELRERTDERLEALKREHTQERLRLQHDHDRAVTERETVKNENDRLNEELKQKEIQLNTFGQTLQDLESVTREKKQLEAQVGKLESSTGDLRLLLEGQRKELMALNEALAEQQGIDKLRQTQQEDCSSVQSTVSQWQNTGEENSSTEFLRKQNEALNQTVKDQQEEIEKTKQQHKAAVSENANLKRDLSAALSREMYEKSPEVILENCKVSETIMSKELDDVIQQLNASEQEIRTLKDELKKCLSPDDKKRLQQQLATKKDQIVHLQNHKHVMYKRIRTLKKTVEILEQGPPSMDDSTNRREQLRELIDKEVALKVESGLIQERLASRESVYYSSVCTMTDVSYMQTTDIRLTEELNDQVYGVDQQSEERHELSHTMRKIVVTETEIEDQQQSGLVRRIQDGTMSFEEFKELFYTSQDDQQLVHKIVLLGVPEIVAHTRVKQFHAYRQVGSCVEGSIMILNIRQHFHLSGDFKAIQHIAQHMEKQFEMKDFDEKLIDTLHILKDISKEKLMCLGAFLQCTSVVNWLKKWMTLRGSKVFVDLAMISAEDTIEPIDIQKFQCFISAVRGFSPLIFDLDKTFDYFHLLGQCELVWKELETNTNLPQQLIDTNNVLPWLQKLKRKQCSVDEISLMAAEAVNNHSVYTVKNTFAHEEDNISHIATRNEIQLSVPIHEGQTDEETYSLLQLEDLKNRLMSLSTEQRQGFEVDITQFTLILDNISRLGNAFKNLCQLGCALFNNLKAQFICNNAQTTVILSFGEGNDIPHLKGGHSPSDYMDGIIPKLAKFIEKLYDEWLEYIDQKRTEYYHLNFFTIDQIVILQREMVKIGSGLEPSHLIYPMLSVVKSDCSHDDLIAALKIKKEVVDTRTTEDNHKQESSKEALFIRLLTVAGIDERLARRALDHVSSNDIEDCDITQALLWCLESETLSSSDISEEETDQKYAAGLGDCTLTLASIIETCLTKQNSQSTSSDSLIQSLKALWDIFIGSISSNISDYLSLEHLGIILTHLAVTDSVHRKLVNTFTEGEPNLLICHSDEILNVTLSVYRHDLGQPLPLSDEILICSSRTSQDEVDVFFRRAVFGNGQRIHCLVNAEMLPLSVSETEEKLLEEYILQTNRRGNKKYRLLIICGSDNAFLSPFVSLLDKYAREVPVTSHDELKKYVSEKLIHPSTNTNSASLVDWERSTARIIKSKRAGEGKSLYVQRHADDLLNKCEQGTALETILVSIHLPEKCINSPDVVLSLFQHTQTLEKHSGRIFHIQMYHEVQKDVDVLMFNLLILNCLTDKNGYVWRRSINDLYLIETTPIVTDTQVHINFLDILPDVICISPEETLSLKTADEKTLHKLFDDKHFKSAEIQRTYQYLHRLDTGQNMYDVNPSKPEGDPKSCLNVLLRRCGLENPSWSELHNFVSFLNTQLVDFENSELAKDSVAKETPGFSTFVLRFLVHLSKEFSTRPLKLSDESPGCIHIVTYQGSRERNSIFWNTLSVKQSMESRPQPYALYNPIRCTFPCMGVYIERVTGDLKHQQTDEILETSIMTWHLFDEFVKKYVPLQDRFDTLSRDQQITTLCHALGIKFPHDPDPTYVLTRDNVLKMIAINMRFRCDIPVVLMGETGCGKTRLVKFMCALQCPPLVVITNLIIVKVHCKTTEKYIKERIRMAERISEKNMEKYGQHMYTVLFFDEANTTEALGIIKEKMCQKHICREPITLRLNLKMVAACNPYRKHSEFRIKKLEQDGLGYHIDAEERQDKIDRIPIRRLFYTVQPLPQSLLPLVWDYGQLNMEVERLYIIQMVRQSIHKKLLPDINGLEKVLVHVLMESQKYMRDQKDECSFVSLRDVERSLLVMAWFYAQANENRILFDAMDPILAGLGDGLLEDLSRCLILAVGVCYHASLRTRQLYREKIAPTFQEPFNLPGGARQMLNVIECCQDVFLNNVYLDKNIARNKALKENVFIMVICIELRIPLFLVGKPGSSKSLAKTIVADAMQGNGAQFPLFKCLKKIRMASYQCSPLSTSDGIVGTFKQCSDCQKDKDLDKFVAVVVLDEVGLAEDGPHMPLQTLHTLLEDGCQGDETPEPYKKVAFIGISNWALNPAKMNRGILVQREVPDLDELITSARGICRKQKDVESFMEPLIEPLSNAYLEVFQRASVKMREFFGLRDFYSLMKMVYGFVVTRKRAPTLQEMLYAIKRNFGGMDLVDAEECFKQHLGKVMNCFAYPDDFYPDCSDKGLIEDCLYDRLQTEGESRYLLLLIENYGNFEIIQKQMFSKHREMPPITIFGSSFRSDREYKELCRNINQIKVCMTTGNTVVLLNLENLYESLHDALNQYYVYFGGERYVDLCHGTHSVKCPVHKNFRLIVVAEKQTVYAKFPIPLLNRLEKHVLSVNSFLDERQINLANELRTWATELASEHPSWLRRQIRKSTPNLGEVFIGYHTDTCSVIIMQVFGKPSEEQYANLSEQEILEKAKRVLLWSVTPEALYRENKLERRHQEKARKCYNKEQEHSSFIQFLNYMLVKRTCPQLFAQITCHSKLLAVNHYEKEITESVVPLQRVEILSLSAFDTEQQFSNRVNLHFVSTENLHSLLVIQCDSGDKNTNVIACARYRVMDEYEKIRPSQKMPTHIVFIVQLPRQSRSCFRGFQCGVWKSVHLDDLHEEDKGLPSIEDMYDKGLGELFEGFVQHQTLGFGEYPEKTETENTVFDKTNLKGIIMLCVQPALAMVKDKDTFPNRETIRVDILLSSLRDNKDQTESGAFTTGIFSLLGKLFIEKEQASGHLDEQWMTKEAAATENINKSGTFRRSCYNTIIAKVKPLLAGILAFLDTNGNLDLMVCDVQWKRAFFHRCLTTKGVLELKYANLQSPWNKCELKQIIVSNTGYENHQFEPRFPFSWVIIETLDEQFRNIVFDGDGQERINKCAIGLKSGPSGQILLEMEIMLHVNSDSESDQSLNPSLQDVLEDFIHDFVHTVYNAEHEAELNIVVQTIMFRTADICGTSSETPDLLFHIVCVRFAYEELSRRLVDYRRVNQVWPNCSAKIEEIKKANPEHIMFKEQEFTYSTLCLLIENLNPTRKDLHDRNGQCQWLNKVYHYRPVVETVLHKHGEDPINYGYHSIGSKRTNSMWSRVVVLKMFLENVVLKETEDDIRIKHIFALWVVLGDDIDLKEIKSVNAVEKFLMTCNNVALEESIGSDVRCCHCTGVLKSAPISVPCSSQHILCHTCCVEMRALKEYTCPQCDEEFDIEDDWVPVVDENRKVWNEKLAKYQQRCNTFFLEVVAQLCFSEGEPPSEQVLERLISYVTYASLTGRRYTKNMNLFGTGVDPNPVFRSFLLQLMLKFSKEKYVSKYLMKLIEHTRCDEKINNDEMNEIYLLIVHCWEDTQLQYMERDGEVKTDYVCQSLEHANTILNDPDNISDQLFAIARSRACLAITAKCLERYAGGENVQTMTQDDRKVMQAAQLLCQNNATEWPKIYLVKLLCRRYGIDLYQTLSMSEFPILKWLAIEGTEQELEVVDRYIVCGDVYTSIREAVAKTILGEDVKNIEELLHKMQKSDPHHEIHLQLALHREIACANVRHTLRGPSQGMQRLSTFLEESNIFKDKDQIMKVLSNELRPEFLKMETGTDLMHQGIQCLLTHFKLSMSCLEDNSTLLRPLIALMKGYPIILNMLLPTMPQDDFDDVQEAVLATRGTETPTFYRCPNGHPYVIGIRVRPVAVGKCLECGQEIGGTGYNSFPGNIANTQGDTTKTGHILGKAVTGGAIKPERALNPTYCTAARLILHMAMYFCPVQQVQSIIKPALETDQVSRFLLDHIRSNINDLQRALGRCADDVFLLMHIAINTMLQKQDLRVPTSVAELKSKADRKAWENEFSSSILNELFGKIDTHLTEWNNRLATDKHFGADHLMCQIYETENYQDMTDKDNLASNPRMWRFRTPITIQHMYQDLESKSHDGSSKRSLLVLQRFMKEDYLLQALRYVPGVLRLQRLLLHKYQKKLDKSEANILKVKDIKKENFSGHDIDKWIQDFACAWEITRKILEQYGCPTEFGRKFVPKEFCNQSVNDNTPLAVFLPSTSGPGLCSYVMLDFLFRKQNDFLDSYASVSQRTDMIHQTIKPAAVTSAHLICYDHEHDLMPLVLANCHYSFEMGVGSKIEYDFDGLERQLIDRLLYSKSRIAITAFLEIDLMIYQTEVTIRTVFMRLAERIPQVPMNWAVRTQIFEELQTLSDVCRSLDNLDIAISFLKTTGGLCQSQLNIFMVETLKIENAMLSQKARQSCELQHARALWLLLSLQRSKLLIDHRQSTEEVFETLQDNMFEDLEDDVKAKSKEFMKTLSVDKLSVILEVMHEFLLLIVAIRTNPDDEDNVDTSSFSFIDGLREYVAESEPALVIDEATLEDFPNKILYKHGAKAWVLAYKTLRKKLGNKRR